MLEPLTPQQQKVFDFIKAQIRQKGYPPAIREICVAVGLASTSTIHAHLKSLERKGYIRRPKSKNRSIEVLEGNFYTGRHEVIDLPVIGHVAAGAPILADENIEDSFPLSSEYISDGNTFMVRVNGDSMVDAGILHRDLIMVREQPDADNGDMVVAIIDDSVTVKFFHREEGYVRLEPANSAYQSIMVKDVRIAGKVIGLFRKF